jgi:hypothetical protein
VKYPGLSWNDVGLLVFALLDDDFKNSNQALVDNCEAFKNLLNHDGLVPQAIVPIIIIKVDSLLLHPNTGVIKAAIRCSCVALKILAHNDDLQVLLRALLENVDFHSNQHWFTSDVFIERLRQNGLRETLDDLMDHVDDEIGRLSFHIMQAVFPENVRSL